jgi:hypothetical protein
MAGLISASLLAAFLAACSELAAIEPSNGSVAKIPVKLNIKLRLVEQGLAIVQDVVAGRH